MTEHPYRAPTTRVTRRAKVEVWVVALVVVWLASVARAAAIFFDHSLAGLVTGLSFALAILIPVIAVNARVLAGGGDDDVTR